MQNTPGPLDSLVEPDSLAVFADNGTGDRIEPAGVTGVRPVRNFLNGFWLSA